MIDEPQLKVMQRIMQKTRIVTWLPITCRQQSIVSSQPVSSTVQCAVQLK